MEQLKIIFKTCLLVSLWFIALCTVLVAASVMSAKLEKPDAAVAVKNSQKLAIDNVNLITMTDAGVIENRQLRISEGMISEILPAGSTTDDTYNLIDAHGAYIIPGMIDMHVHIYDRKQLELTLACGVTTVRNMRGKPVHLRWKRELEEHEWLGSSLFTSSPIIGGPVNSNILQKPAADPEYARVLVRRYKADGYDFIKVYANLGVEEFHAVIEEADTLNMDVSGHPPYALFENDIDSLSGMTTIEHAQEIFQGGLKNEFNHDRMQDIVKQLKSLDVGVTPTLINFEYLVNLSNGGQSFADSLPLEYLDPFYRFAELRFDLKWLLQAPDQLAAHILKEKEFLEDIVAELHRQGVMMVVGSDAGANLAAPGIATLEEINELAGAGLSADEVLRAATINAAVLLDIGNRYGSIEIHKAADLVMYEKDPRDDLRILEKPVAVVKNGQWLDRNDLESLKMSAGKPSGFFIAMGRFLEDILVRKMY